MIHVVRRRIANALLAALPAAIIALATMILLRFSPRTVRLLSAMPHP
jgi:hypothetical protein